MATTSSPSSPPPPPPALLKIGILGTGNMGRALGIRYAQLGHDVFFSGRSPNDAPQRAAEAANALAGRTTPSTTTTTTTMTTTATTAAAQYGTLDQAAAASDVLVWTMRERDPRQVLSSAGIAALSDKVVLDVNNRDYADEVAGTGAGSGTGDSSSSSSKWFDTSLGEQLQTGLPRAHVLKAFNTIAMEALDTSSEALRAAQAQVFVAGGAGAGAAAAAAVSGRAAAVRLVGELGFEVVDLGGAPAAMRVAEALGDAVRYVMIENGKGARVNIGVRSLPPPDLGVVGGREQSSYH